MIRQAIKVKFLGPGNKYGPRLKAIADAGSVVTKWDHGLSDVANYRACAEALMLKFGWTCKALECGAIGNEYFFVLVGEK